MPRPNPTTPAARRAADARQCVARQDMATGLAGLFRPVVRGGKRTWVEGLRQKWNGGIIEFAGPELDAGDLLVLLALQMLALRAHQHRAAQENAGSEKENGLIPMGKNTLGNKAITAATISVQTTMADICRAIGRDPGDGRAHSTIKATLKRLSAVVVEARQGDDWATTHLIAGGAGRGRGAVTVALNYRLTRALLGDGSYGRVDVRRLAALPPVAQVLAAWLACWRPTPGRCPPVSIDALCRHVWGGDAATPALQRRHRQQVREALAALPQDEWLAQVLPGASMARIERLPAGGADG